MLQEELDMLEAVGAFENSQDAEEEEVVAPTLCLEDSQVADPTPEKDTPMLSENISKELPPPDSQAIFATIPIEESQPKQESQPVRPSGGPAELEAKQRALPGNSSLTPAPHKAPDSKMPPPPPPLTRKASQIFSETKKGDVASLRAKIEVLQHEIKKRSLAKIRKPTLSPSRVFYWN